MSLDYDFLSILVKKDEAYIIYADRCLIDEEFMRKHNIIFKKVPRDIVRF
jgi:adenine-specific DNA-methyltransferase